MSHSQAYQEQPEDSAPACAAQYPGCMKTARVYIPCRVEGMQVPACMSCLTIWKNRARQDPMLAMRCPRCEGHAQRQAEALEESRSAVLAAALPPPLEGAAAVAIQEALFREGIPGPTRTRIMRRLARDAYWLADASPHIIRAGLAEDPPAELRAVPS